MNSLTEPDTTVNLLHEHVYTAIFCSIYADSYFWDELYARTERTALTYTQTELHNLFLLISAVSLHFWKSLSDVMMLRSRDDSSIFFALRETSVTETASAATSTLLVSAKDQR